MNEWRLGGRKLYVLDPYDCPRCGRRVCARPVRLGYGPCQACLAEIEDERARR